jgi:3-oxosteroid 1-dehydrogenase
MANALEFDVVVIGSGFAGLSTALAARAAALSVAVLEKDNLVGGGSAWSQGAVWIGANSMAREAGLPDSPAAAARYLEVLSGGEGDPARMRAFVENGPAALDLFRSVGIPFVLTMASDHLYHMYGEEGGGVARGRTLEADPFDGSRLGRWRGRLQTPMDPNWRLPLVKALKARNHHEVQSVIREAEEKDLMSWGAGLIAHFLHHLIESGASVATGTAAASLIVDNGQVAGVTSRDGRAFMGRCGVVIATGGYDSNPAMARELEGLPDFQSVFPDSITGDGLRLGVSVGGAIAKIGNSLLVQLADSDPSLPGNAGSRQVATTEVTRPHGIVVNRFGRRFGDETSFQTLAPALRAYDPIARVHANLPCWLIFDQQFADKFGYGAGYGGGKVGEVPDRIPRAGDLATLAGSVGIDPAGLVNAVARFNENSERGEDPEFGRGTSVWSVLAGTPCLGPISKPPFYAARLRPFAMSSAGLRVDDRARVQTWDGVTIEGLYAVGNAAVHSEYGVGYQAGISLGSAMTFGYLAARDMRQDA